MSAPITFCTKCGGAFRADERPICVSCTEAMRRLGELRAFANGWIPARRVLDGDEPLRLQPETMAALITELRPK